LGDVAGTHDACRKYCGYLAKALLRRQVVGRGVAALRHWLNHPRHTFVNVELVHPWVIYAV
jgi:hypothetical protein